MDIIKNVLGWLRKLDKESFISLFAELIFFSLLAILVLSSYLSNSFSEESYLYMRLSESPFRDELSFNGRVRIFSLLPILLHFLSLFLSLELAIKYIPLLIGLVSVILFSLILRRYFLFKIRVIAMFILIFSPSFLSIYGSFNSLLFPLLTVLLTLFLLEYNWKFIFLLLILPFFSMISAVLIMPLLLLYVLKNKELRLLYAIPLLFLILGSYLLIYGFPEILILEKTNFFYNAVSDLSGVYGVSLFIWILSIFGFLKIWENKYRHLWFYLIIIFLILSSFYYIKSLIYLNFFLSILGSYGFYKLWGLGWESNVIKKIIIGIMVFGLIFSFVSYFTLNKGISKDMEDSLNFLISRDNRTVFSHYSNGILINSVAKKKNVMDSDFFYASKLREKYNDSLTLFYTRDLDEAIRLIKKYDIGYILVDERMEKGLVWSEEEEGLLFLLKYSTKFKKIYESKTVEIFKVEL